MAGQIFDLFAALGADDDQLDFPVLYASAKQARARLPLGCLKSLGGLPLRNPREHNA